MNRVSSEDATKCRSSVYQCHSVHAACMYVVHERGADDSVDQSTSSPMAMLAHAHGTGTQSQMVLVPVWSQVLATWTWTYNGERVG